MLLSISLFRGTLISLRWKLLTPLTKLFPRASSKGAHGSQSDDSTYLAKICAVVFTLPLTSRLCSQLQELQEVANLPPQKSISFSLPELLDRELSPDPGGTKLMLYHWAIHTSSNSTDFCEVFWQRCLVGQFINLWQELESLLPRFFVWLEL